ncbi:hypothetical protein BJV78DRAFT_510998 [Lactifluus subvellereus]|nr:hypothetical protein BJV78DRAFT_510998 [Lactifluus subvellereus]
MPVYDLPMRNDASAPRFDEDKPCELANYFEELEDLFERHRVSDAADRKRSAVRYVSVDVRELWQYATAWDDPRRSYEDFKAEVYALYPEATDTFRYTAWDLEALVNEQAQREMQSTEDLHAFYRKFIVISTFLVKRNRLSTLEQARWFLGAFSGNQAGHLRQRLELKHPDAHINDIPDFVDIFEEAQLVLRRQLYSAQATGATAPEAPRHPEKRNATTARAPNAAPLTVAPSTPTIFSSRPAPMAAPLTPDTATGPCQKGSTAPTAISAAASAPRATRGPLSDYPPMMEHPSSQGSTSSDREHRKRGAKGCNHTSTVGNLSTTAGWRLAHVAMSLR